MQTDSTASMDQAVAAYITPLYDACRRGDVAAVRGMLRDAPYDNMEDYFAQALREACSHGQAAVAALLLAPVSAGGAGLVPCHARAQNNYVLRVACQCGFADVVKVLLAPVDAGGAGLGAADARTDNNMSLRWACEEGHTEVVRLLLAPADTGGAGLRKYDALDACALQGAAKHNHPELLKLLLTPAEKGGCGCYEPKDIFNYDVYEIAEAEGHKEIEAFLAEYLKDVDTSDWMF